MLSRDLAICIRVVDYSETSQIVTFFARETGKITAIAKGSKRPKSAFDGPIEIFAQGEIVFSNSDKDKLATLTEFEQRPAFAHLSGNLFVLNCSLFAAELLNNLTTDYDPHPDLCDSFLRFLQNINEIRDTLHASRDALTLLILFQLSLLKEIGLQPVLTHCVNCKTRYEMRLSAEASAKAEATRYEFYFSSSANGLICRDCEPSFPDKIRLTNTAAAVMCKPKSIAHADKEALNEIERLLIHHFTDLLHRPPKMAKHILSAATLSS